MFYKNNMKKKLVSLFLIFTFLFTTLTTLELTSVNTYALVKKTIKNKGKNKVVWKNYNRKTYAKKLRELGWYDKYDDLDSRTFKRDDENNGYAGGQLDAFMGNSFSGKTTYLVYISNFHMKKYAPEYNKALEKSLAILIPDGAKEIVAFANKIRKDPDCLGEYYVFYNVNGTTVVVNETSTTTDIYIFNKPYMKKKDFEKVGLAYWMY